MNLIFCPKKVLFTTCTSIDFISLKGRFWRGFLKVRVKKYRYSTLCNTRPSYSLTQKGSQNRGVRPKSGGKIVSHYNLHGQGSTTARFLFGILQVDVFCQLLTSKKSKFDSKNTTAAPIWKSWISWFSHVQLETRYRLQVTHLKIAMTSRPKKSKNPKNRKNPVFSKSVKVHDVILDGSCVIKSQNGF